MENESPGIPERCEESAQSAQRQHGGFRRLVRRRVTQPSRSTWHAYLGELLASRGFICVSVDENFLNGSGAGGIGKENGVRGWILLQHLAAWRKWNSTTGNPFLGKVDLDAIALTGHSRGGEAVALAAAFNKLKCFPDELCQSTTSSF